MNCNHAGLSVLSSQEQIISRLLHPTMQSLCAMPCIFQSLRNAVLVSVSFMKRCTAFRTFLLLEHLPPSGSTPDACKHNKHSTNKRLGFVASISGIAVAPAPFANVPIRPAAAGLQNGLHATSALAPEGLTSGPFNHKSRMN